ncbi:MAG TPA: hypothetical protein VM509_01330, partial [Planctomycetota bacterium]|nr:hypothetical protein [Planctomycetota bacterium]
MDAELVGQVLHPQRREVARPALEEFFLVLEEPRADLPERLAAHLERFDDGARALQLVAQVLAHRGRARAVL